MKATRIETVPQHRPALLPVTHATLQHHCCLHKDAVPAEFAVIAAEVLDCFATAFYAAPVKIADRGELRFECALVIDEEDIVLRLRLRASVETSGGKTHSVAIETPAVLFIMAAVRRAAVYKQIELTPIVCSDDTTCEFHAGYPGKLRIHDLPGLGDPGSNGEPCWPTSVLHAPLPTARVAMQARTIIEWLRSGAEAKVH